MAAPPKLWEKHGTYNHRQPNFNPDSNSFIQSYPFTSGSGGGGRVPVPAPGPAPPLPPRPTSYSNSSNTYMRSTFGPYGSYGGFGGYGSSYGPYGSGLGGYNRFGMIGPPSHLEENRFIQLAEESSRPAFESIESIVHAFGSVSMMLESTYHAVHSSFRAVLGVAEHFGRMKSHFAQIFSALAVIRTLRWLYRKLLYLIGLRVQDPSLEMAWQSSTAANSGTQQITESDIKASKSSWPVIMFLAVVFGGPYLIWKLLYSIVLAPGGGWMKGQGNHYGAVAVYPFKAGNRQELSMNPGDMLYLAPRAQQSTVRGWLMASNGTSSGLVPANYIKITGHHTLPAPGSKTESNQNTTNTTTIAKDHVISRDGPVNRGPNESNMRMMRTVPSPSGPFGTAHLPYPKPKPDPHRNNHPIHANPPNMSHYSVNHQLPHSSPSNTTQLSSSVHQHLPTHSAQHPSSFQVTNPQIQSSQQHFDPRMEAISMAQHKPDTHPPHAQQQLSHEDPINPLSSPSSRESCSTCSTQADDSGKANRKQNNHSDQCPPQQQNVQAMLDDTSTSEQVDRTRNQMTNEQERPRNKPENSVRHEFSHAAQEPDKVTKADYVTAPPGDPRGARAKVRNDDGRVNESTTSAQPTSVDTEVSDFLSQFRDEAGNK